MTTEVENNNKGAKNYTLEQDLDESYLYSMTYEHDEK